MLIFGAILGLALGVMIGIATQSNDLTEPVWAFLGVLVGAGVTLFAEESRREEERQKRTKEWKRDQLTRVQEAVDDVARTYGHLMAVRIDSINTSSTFPSLPPLSPETHDFGEALRRLNMVSAPYLSEDLQAKTTELRKATADLARYAPEQALKPMDDQTKEALRKDLKGRTDKIIDLVEGLTDLLHAALADVAP
jgi:hypothetical protein